MTILSTLKVKHSNSLQRERTRCALRRVVDFTKIKGNVNVKCCCEVCIQNECLFYSTSNWRTSCTIYLPFLHKGTDKFKIYLHLSKTYAEQFPWKQPRRGEHAYYFSEIKWIAISRKFFNPLTHLAGYIISRWKIPFFPPGKTIITPANSIAETLTTHRARLTSAS